MSASEFDGHEIALIREIFGVPSDTAVATLQFSHLPPVLAHIWDPSWTTGDFTQLWAAILDRLDSADAFTIQRVRLYLTKWDEFGGSSPMRITSSQGGDSGLITDHPQERENIREIIGNLMGIMVPAGGFYRDMKIRLRYATAAAQMQNGDR